MGQGILPAHIVPCSGQAVEGIQVEVVAVSPSLGEQRIPQRVTDILCKRIEANLAREAPNGFRVIFILGSDVPVVLERAVPLAIVSAVLDIPCCSVHPGQRHDVLCSPHLRWRLAFRCSGRFVRIIGARTRCGSWASVRARISVVRIPVCLFIDVVRNPLRHCRQIQLVDVSFVELGVEVLERAVSEELDFHHRLRYGGDGDSSRLMEIAIDNLRIEEDVVDVLIEAVESPEHFHVFLVVER